jgi:hypothetical protein
MATMTVRAVAVNSQGAAVPSVTRVCSAARKLPAAVNSWAMAQPARKTSGGLMIIARRPLVRV